MKHHLLIFLFLGISFAGMAQIHFEKGYFINSSNEKIECYIKNIGWNLNPSEFIYKLEERSELLTGTIKTVKEFGISNSTKFVKFKVKIDESIVSDRTAFLSKVKAPEYVEKELFLKTLIEGEANLYEYKTSSIKKYFYKKSNTAVEQLLYKVYFTEVNNRIGENNIYKRQLGTDLKCESIEFKDIGKIKYSKKQLLAFFKKYNKCTGSEIEDFDSKLNKNTFNANFKVGLNQSSLTLHGVNFNLPDVEVGKKISPRFGFELEYILPFNHNKWAIFLEPTLQVYKVSQDAPLQKASVNYKSLEFPIGARYYLFLTDKSKFFVNAALTLDFEFDSSIVLGTSNSLILDTRPTLAFGLGFKQNDIISLEFRHYINREIIGENTSRRSDFRISSLVLGFTIPY